MKIDKNTMFTSDTHFGHANVVRFDDSPFYSEESKKLAKVCDAMTRHTPDDEFKSAIRRLRVSLEADVKVQDEAIIKNWNAVVDPDQLVIHLGDFTFIKNVDDILSILDRLNGKIILIKGNHEQPVMKNKVVQDRFEFITDYLEVFMGKQQRICCFHYPIHEWNQGHRGAWMLHGHTHKKDTYDTQFKICNVGCMNWNYKPVSFEQLQIFMADKNNINHH